MKLAYSDTGAGPPVVLMHGMFGSRSNLAAVGRALSDAYRVISVDLRNHGESPHDAIMDYPVMADDIVELLDALGIERAHLLGHSLGGKVGMQVALTRPERVDKLIVADISPVTYGGRHDGVLDGLAAVAGAGVKSRRDADAVLANHVEDAGVRAFLLKNLQRGAHGRYTLKLNLDALAANYFETLTLAPAGAPYSGPVLFIKGADSAYIQDKHRDAIVELFPAAELKIIAGAGHWLHADKPAIFNRLVRNFLDNQSR